MSDAINRAMVSRARQILRVEQWLVIFSAAAATVLLGASIYFEKSYDTAPYSFVFLIGFFLASLACFWALFEAFKDSFRYRASRRGTRAMFTLASAYVVVASVLAYAVAFGLFGLDVPWAGPGRDMLYASYFLLATASAFLARSLMFYWRLRAYMMSSLGSLVK